MSSGLAADERSRHDADEAADEAAVPHEADAAEGRAHEVRVDLAPVLDEPVDAGADEAAHAGGDHQLVGELGLDAAALDERPHDGEAGHDDRQRGHEAEAVELEVADLEEDRAHAWSV